MWFFMLVIAAIILVFEIILAIFVVYLLLLTIIAWVQSKNVSTGSAEPQSRLLILTPAHNEEQLLPELLQSLAKTDYPADLFEVHVVADNCTDETAVIARQYAAIPHERFDTERPGKGFALQWFLQNSWETVAAHDAVIILDADTIVSPNFLQAVSARLQNGERVIQAYYAVSNPAKSWSIALRYAALAVLHYLRPLGRTALGGSAGLKGNGMVFATDIMRQYEWSESITEDIEFHMALILGGERVAFAPEAALWAEMPDTLAGSASQNVRWERGRIQMMRAYAPKLLKASVQQLRQRQFSRAYLYLDAAMEHFIPPFSVLMALSGFFFLLSLSLLAVFSLIGQSGATSAWAANLLWFNLFLAFALIVGQAVYLLTGLRLVHAPKAVYKALLKSPLFIVWKVWHYTRVVFGLDSHGWVRTARNNEV
jgi:1,2-diacylglycerol 3-beta-glucosyltransferase